ncbi:MAG: Crp/Fnr family transcriptional regulator [Bacteroidales bacterium]|nr:Crp/Fnr family transcriptional regulator [Bacteroidales bacterium]
MSITNSKMPDCAACFFKNGLCKGLSEDEFKSIFTQTRHYTYSKGEIIYKQGSKCDDLIFLTSGIVKFVTDSNGKELIVAIDKAQTLLGLANVLNESINLFTIVAVTECSGCMINLNRFSLYLMNNRQFMFEILSLSTQMFRGAIFNFISVARKQSNGRVADILLYLSQKIYESRSFSLDLSRQELADYAGCSKEQLIHTLRNFSTDGIINVSGKKVEILDVDKLMTISRVG